MRSPRELASELATPTAPVRMSRDRRLQLLRRMMYDDGGFGVTAGVPYRLVVTAQPQSAAANASLGTITVQVQDAFGNPAFGVFQVAMWFANNAGPGHLAGTLTQTTSNGVATFTGLSVTIAANGYTLQAMCPLLTRGISAAFNVTGTGGTVHVVPTTGNPTGDGAAALTAILSTAVSGDTVQLTAGTYDVGNNACSTPDGVSVIGPGSGLTTIKSGNTSVRFSSMKNPGGACLAGFTLLRTAPSSFFTYGIGNEQGEVGALNCASFDVAVTGFDLAFGNDANSGPTPTTGTHINCTFNADSGGISAEQSAINATFFNCTVNLVGPPPPTTSCEGVSIIAAPGTTITLDYCSISVVNGGSIGSVGVFVHRTTGTTIYGGSVSTSNTLGTAFDLQRTSQGTLTAYGTIYQTTSGTVGQNSVLAITQSPSTAVHGVTLAAVTVAFQDNLGNTQTVNNSGQVQVFLQNAGTGLLIALGAGTLTQTAAGGVCTFGDLVVSSPGNYNLVFCALGMTSVSTPVLIT